MSKQIELLESATSENQKCYDILEVDGERARKALQNNDQ